MLKISSSNATYFLCDKEGRIYDASLSAETMLQYSHQELIKTKRIFNFFHKNIVLNEIKRWLALSKTNHQKFHSVMKRQDGSHFTAYLSIKPIKNDNKYYLISITRKLSMNPTTLLPTANLRIFFTKWSLIIRAKFLLGTIIPLLFGIVWSIQYVSVTNFPIDILFAIVIGALSFHAAANTFNDYFDWKSGTDQMNTNYLLFVSGGSRAIELGLISAHVLLRFSIISFILVFLMGAYIASIRGPIIFLIGGIGAFSAYYYTAPPIRLAARKGFGELFHILCLGPLFISGTTYALTEHLSAVDFWIGTPIGLLITACLWANEFPDIEADAKTGKNNLAVTFSPYATALGILTLLILSYTIPIISIIYYELPALLLTPLLTIPFGISATTTAFQIQNSRDKIANLCLKIFNVYFYYCLLYIISVSIAFM